MGLFFPLGGPSHPSSVAIADPEVSLHDAPVPESIPPLDTARRFPPIEPALVHRSPFPLPLLVNLPRVSVSS